MWFYAEISKNPEPLQNLANQEDVLRIAKIIKAQDDDFVCSRISFELALGGNSGENPNQPPTREPLLTVAFDILNEKYLLDKNGTKIKSDLENLVKNLNEVGSLISRKDISDILIHSGEFTEQDFLLLKKLIGADKNKIFTPLYDLNQYRKQQHKGWGKLGYYRIFLEKTAELYTELSGKDFTSDFGESDTGKWLPASDGAAFLGEFHKILNRFATTYGADPFTDKNLKNTSNEIRTKRNSLRKSDL